MKKNELLPTQENLINALTKDTIGRNKDIEYFLNILKCQESSCALALNSDSNVIMSQCIQVDNVPIGTLSTCRVKL